MPNLFSGDYFGRLSYILADELTQFTNTGIEAEFIVQAEVILLVCSVLVSEFGEFKSAGVEVHQPYKGNYLISADDSMLTDGLFCQLHSGTFEALTLNSVDQFVEGCILHTYWSDSSALSGSLVRIIRIDARCWYRRCEWDHLIDADSSVSGYHRSYFGAGRHIDKSAVH